MEDPQDKILLEMSVGDFVVLQWLLIALGTLALADQLLLLNLLGDFLPYGYLHLR